MRDYILLHIQSIDKRIPFNALNVRNYSIVTSKLIKCVKVDTAFIQLL